MANERELRADGFQGFVTIASLRQNLSQLPKAGGVYAVIYNSKLKPVFRVTGTGGRHKDRNPNVSIAELDSRWVPGPTVVYYGKANFSKAGRGLRKRFGEFLKFGAGKPVGHRGGRYVWQLNNAEEMIACWKETPGTSPRDIEKQMIAEFAERFQKRPFANING